jgi:hypothetical protein
VNWLALPCRCPGCAGPLPIRIPCAMRDHFAGLPPDTVIFSAACQNQLRGRVRCHTSFAVRATDFAHAIPARARPPRLDASGSHILHHRSRS